MSKAKKKNSSIPAGRVRKITNWADLHRFKTLLIVVVIALVGCGITAAVNNHIKTVRERAQFAQVKTDLDEIYNEIVASVGVPTEHKAVQSCRYTSSDFGTGARSCAVDQYIFYSADSQASSFQKAMQITQIISSSKKVSHFNEIFQNHEEARLYSSFHLGDFPGCGAEFDYLSIAPTTLPHFLFVAGGGLSIDINCSGGARAEYYPLVTTKTGAPI